MYEYSNEEYLQHWGVKGMKWGVRRYQNPDGSLTDAGKKRVSSYKNNEIYKVKKQMDKEINKLSNKASKAEQKIKSLEIKGADAKKINKQQAKRIDAESQAIYKREIGKAEINKIKSMKLSDINEEKKAIGKARAAAAAINMASVTMAMLGARYVVATTPNVKAIKTNRRVNDEQVENAKNKSRQYVVSQARVFK